MSVLFAQYRRGLAQRVLSSVKKQNYDKLHFK